MQTHKSLGQHWLHDPLVLQRIAHSCLADLPAGAPLVEIGPGTGALTRLLLAAGHPVTVVELDPRCSEALSQWPEAASGQLKVVAADALKLDWPATLQPLQPPSTGASLAPRVVGNLPYNVGTEIVARLLLLPRPPERMIFLLQKEVVLRLVAQPNTPDWGRLGALASLLADGRRLYDVPPGAFQPPPKVMSSVVELRPLPTRRHAVDLAKLDHLLRAGFGQRRKMLRSALKGLLTEAQIVAARADPTARMETLDLATLCRLAHQLI